MQKHESARATTQEITWEETLVPGTAQPLDLRP